MALMPEVVAVIQIFGDHINFHPHLHFLVTEGGVDEAGVFHNISCIDDSRLAALFAREVLGFLVQRELFSPEWAKRILSWRHSGFSVHTRVRAKTHKEAERVGKYMIRPLLCLERLSFDEKEAKVCYPIINHLKLTFIASKPPPPQVVYQELLMAAETSAEYFS
jgi:hypothetical protein